MKKRYVIVRGYKYEVIGETDNYYECECLDKKHDSFTRLFAKYKREYSKKPAKGTKDGIWYSNNRSETIDSNEIIFK